MTITGTNFKGATAVTFGGQPATRFKVKSATEIIATTPAGTAGAVDVVVTSPAGTATGTGLFTYDVAVPTVTGITPAAGPVAGGTSVTIRGSNLNGATAVSFGGNPATSFTVKGATEIVATTPAGTAGAADVVVTTPRGTATGTGLFIYDASVPTVTGISPATGPSTGGTSVKIQGTGFTGATAVTFDGIAATKVVVNSATQITATTPGGSTGAVNVVVVTPNGSGTGASLFTYVDATPKTAFDAYKNDIKRIVQDQAEKRLTVLMGENDRMMQDARTRFMGFVVGSDDAQSGLSSTGFDAVALDVTGSVDASGDANGVVAASSGEFLGQTGMVDGVNWRLFGNFDLLLDDGDSMTAVDARVAREQFIGDHVLWGAFGGGQYSGSDISDSFSGDESTWQLYAGTYAVSRFSDYLFADAYASIGYGWSNLDMANDVLALDSNYGTVTWQVGGSLVGRLDMDRFSVLPTVTVAYGNSNLGEIDFTANAYGMSDGMSLDADYVAMGVLRLTPEIRIPLGADSTSTDGVTVGILPSLICQQVIADDADSGCGWGAGLELTQQSASSLGQFNGRFDYELVNGISRVGGQLGYSVQF